MSDIGERVNVSSSNSNWAQRSFDSSQITSEQDEILKRNSAIQVHSTNMAMMEYGNVFQKLYYFIKDLFDSERAENDRLYRIPVRSI